VLLLHAHVKDKINLICGMEFDVLHQLDPADAEQERCDLFTIIGMSFKQLSKQWMQEFKGFLGSRVAKSNLTCLMITCIADTREDMCQICSDLRKNHSAWKYCAACIPPYCVL